MEDPLPDPRIDTISDIETSEEEDEVEDLFASLKTTEDQKLCDMTEGQKDDNNVCTETSKGMSSKKSNKCPKKCRKKSQKKYLVCNECHPIRTFKKQRILDLHQQVIHNTAKVVVCLWCAKQFVTQNQLLIHQKLYFHDRPLD